MELKFAINELEKWCHIWYERQKGYPTDEELAEAKKNDKECSNALHLLYAAEKSNFSVEDFIRMEKLGESYSISHGGI